VFTASAPTVRVPASAMMRTAPALLAPAKLTLAPAPPAQPPSA
jgi:hypothetical protein